MQICEFPGSRRIGSPKDWDDELDGKCLDIFVVDAVDPLSGVPFMYSCYKLSDAEIEALRNGGLLRLGISGTRMPVLNMSVLSPEFAAAVEAEPRGDLGGVLELPAA